MVVRNAKSFCRLVTIERVRFNVLCSHFACYLDSQVLVSTLEKVTGMSVKLHIIGPTRIMHFTLPTLWFCLESIHCGLGLDVFGCYLNESEDTCCGEVKGKILRWTDVFS